MRPKNQTMGLSSRNLIETPLLATNAELSTLLSDDSLKPNTETNLPSRLSRLKW